MELKEITPTNARQNLYQFIKDVNHNQPILIKGRSTPQSAVLMSEKQYQHLQKSVINFSSTPHDILYQKLHLLDTISDNLTFYSVAQSAISISFRQASSINRDPIWSMGLTLLGVISCYTLRANGQQLDQQNLIKLSQKSYPELLKFAKLMSPKDKDAKSLYDDVINNCQTSFEAIANTKKTINSVIQLYRLLIA